MSLFVFIGASLAMMLLASIFLRHAQKFLGEEPPSHPRSWLEEPIRSENSEEPHKKYQPNFRERNVIKNSSTSFPVPLDDQSDDYIRKLADQVFGHTEH